MSESSANVDPYIFFGILFGSSIVEPYVGNLAIASIVDNLLRLTDKAEAEDSTPQQARRQIEIARHLRDRIKTVVSGDVSTEIFQSSCRREALSLRMAMNGNEAEFLLKAISSGLVSATHAYVKFPTWARSLLNWAYGSFDKSSYDLRAMLSLEREVRKAIIEVTPDESHDNQCNKEKSTADIDTLLKRISVPKILKLVWNFNVNDIANTVKEATKRVLDDCGENHVLRMEKAKALNILGRELYHAIDYVRNDDQEIDEQKLKEDVEAALLDSITNDFFE
jgi:hypothetical protein